MNEDKDFLPRSIRDAAIEFALKETGMSRPHKSQTVHIRAFEECYKLMVELGMVKQENQDGKEKSS